jgi:thiol-disulfide isomerase/thioredoxin
LAGEVSGGKLRLATFDGAHAFLFDAVIQTDGSIAGDFWSGNSWHETWTAIRDDRAELPDGFDEVHLTGPADWSKVMVQDNQGQRLSLADAKVFGELTIVNVFGSWCPNCHDEAAYLVELDQKYASSGLHIVGLAFEASGEFDQDISQVGRYAARHSVGYPLFLAGESDKEKVAKALPFLDKFKAFPTSLFVDRSGKVIAVYSGFSGPATGQAHEDLKRRFEEIIRRELRD